MSFSYDYHELDVKSGYSTKNPILRAMFRKFFNKIRRTIDRFDVNNILDVGCGEGITIKNIRMSNHVHVVGLDISDEFLKTAKKINHDVDFIKGDIYDLPFGDDSFDLVICTEVLEHLINPEKALKELKRVSRRFCLISVPHEPIFRVGNILKLSYLRNLGNTPGHIQNWSKKSFENLLKKHFKKISIDLSLLVWMFVICEK